MSTNTPRTDEAEFFMSTSDKQSPDEGCMMVEAFFARQLERELAEAQADRARLEYVFAECAKAPDSFFRWMDRDDIDVARNPQIV